MFDLVGRRYWYFLFSLLVILPGAVSLLIPPALRPGIEFSSGSTLTLKFEEAVAAEDLRAALAELDHSEARVQRTSEGSFLVRTRELAGAAAVPPVGPAPPSERDAIVAALRERFGPVTVQNFESVSAAVSRQIGRNATIAVVAASVAILLYITWAFRRLPKPFLYGVCALVALGHDVLVVVGAFSIFGKLFGTEINTMFVTGLLTIIGFSVHDTIVVFDRIRENIGRLPGWPLHDVVNASLWETMGRSLNTSLTLVFTIVALLLLGGVTIRDFLLVLLIGVISGTYSSIAIASQLLVTWESGDLQRLWRRLILRLVPASGG